MADPTPLDLCIDAVKAALAGATGISIDDAAAGICGAMVDVSSAATDGLATTDDVANVGEGLNTLLLLYGGALVFLMHGGFAMLCAGAIRSKNAMNILLQTILDAAVSALMWYLVGFGFAFGQGNKPNKFIGDAIFAMTRWDGHFTGTGYGRWTDWFFQWAFAATAVTIPAGAVAERFNFNAYLGYSMFIAGWVYPVVAHWVWCVQGWLGYGTIAPFLKAGYIDFAGSGVIHMVGGLAGLVGCVLVGPRLGRFDADGKPVAMPGHSAILVVLGTVLLWFGWYGFNPASVGLINSAIYGKVAGRAAVTTTLAGAGGGVSCLIYGFIRHRGWDLVGLCNGILCGFVAITACCHVVEPWAAIALGFVVGPWFELLCALWLKLRIDDPLSAAPMHFGAGMLGVFWTGLLAKREFIMEYYAHGPSAEIAVALAEANPTATEDELMSLALADKNYFPYGAFYKGSSGKLLASQIVGILAIIGWTVGNMGVFFGIFKALGRLRIPPEEEEMGLDRSKHGGSAYNGNAAGALGNDVMRAGSPSSQVKVMPSTA